MKTKAGIYLNLEESTYKVNIFGIIFYFSSKFYMEKFKKDIYNYCLQETLKLKNKSGININFNIYFAICLYNKIEKRGFRVETINKEKITKDTTLTICIY